jgi:hypothetical protein
VRDRKARATVLVSAAPGGQPADGSSSGKISGNGRFVAFNSSPTNLVANDTNGFCDVFLRDLKRGTTTRISVGPGGAQGDECSFVAGLSGNARFVAVNTYASNLAPGTGAASDHRSNLLVYDRRTSAVTVEMVGPGGEPSATPANTPHLAHPGVRPLGRPLRGLPHGGHQPGRRRRQRAAGRVPP